MNATSDECHNTHNHLCTVFHLVTGLPSGWTDPNATVRPAVVNKMFKANFICCCYMVSAGFNTKLFAQDTGSVPCISLFTGVAGLELGLRGSHRLILRQLLTDFVF